jgi:Tol biopolymer transport system component
MRRTIPSLLCSLSLAACSSQPIEEADTDVLKDVPNLDATLLAPGERRIKNIRQLTFAGQNAEAYFNAGATELIFQSTRDGLSCDQIFLMDVDGRNQRLVSTGLGRTTCGYLFPNQPRMLYSSTHAELKVCPPKPDHSRGYVWRLEPTLDLYAAGPNGERPTALAPHPGYDAEGVVSPLGDRILFTSTRSGDVDIFSMAADGSDVRQLTSEIGYDGGAFFSLDGSKIVYRAHHPTDPDALAEYKALLADHLVRPSVMELFVMNADGSDKRQITHNGAANFAPYFHPDGQRVIFASNMDDPKGRDFDLYMIRTDGTHLERVTFDGDFDAFPMFSYDGKRLVFASNRHGAKPGDTNVFVADWVERLPPPPESGLRGPAEIEAATWLSRAQRIADPALQGRALGTPQLDQAAQLIVDQYRMIGLLPAGDKDTYLQAFQATPVGESAVTAHNVVGRLPADPDGAPTARAIVIGAHYDHLGTGGEGSLRPDVKAAHPGADDNASGVATILELAEALSVVANRKLDVYVVAFSGEEAGLLGSAHFAQHLPIKPGDVAMMLNFDMVGRMEGDRLSVYGVGTGTGSLKQLRAAQVGLDLDLALSADGWGPSDHLSFLVQKIPALHFFTGQHADYHTPDDTADKLNAEGGARVTALAWRLAIPLVTGQWSPAFVEAPAALHGQGPQAHSSRSYGPYLGTIPAFGASLVKGAAIQGARPGSPAEAAGIKAGDVIVKLGDAPVTDMKSYAEALRAHQPGDTVQIVVIREGVELTLTATLTQRPD